TRTRVLLSEKGGCRCDPHSDMVNMSSSNGARPNSGIGPGRAGRPRVLILGRQILALDFGPGPRNHGGDSMATRPWFVAIDHRLLANDDPEADRTLALEGVRRALQKGFSLREALLLFGDNLSPQDVRMLANETRGGPGSNSIPEEDHIFSAPNEAA